MLSAALFGLSPQTRADTQPAPLSDPTGGAVVGDDQQSNVSVVNSADAEQQLRERLVRALPGVEITRIEPSPIPNVYEVETANQQLLYASETGDYFIAGDIFKLEGDRIVNLAEQRRESARAAAVASVPESEKVVFKPESTKAVINVFTDVDCGYCRKLHQEMPQLLEKGIQVNYLAFPRAGIGSSSYEKMVSVWCADDQQEAMNTAKSGKQPKARKCENTVAAQYELGNKIGISGTPAIVLADGRIIPGYLPANALAQNLGLEDK